METILIANQNKHFISVDIFDLFRTFAYCAYLQRIWSIFLFNARGTEEARIHAKCQSIFLSPNKSFISFGDTQNATLSQLIKNLLFSFINLHKMFTVCVDTTFSVSCIFNPWHTTTNDRLFGSTTAVMFDIVTHPPVEEN